MLGEFEYLLLSAAARLGEGAYGAAIRREIEGATKRRCSIGALYTTLDRLEGKGLVRTWMGDPTPQRGGRPKRMVRVTGEGGQEVAFLLCLAGALTVWSWTCGFVLGSLSGRAVWLTWSVFYFVVLDSAWARFVLTGRIILRNPRTHEALLHSLQGTLRVLMATTLPLSIAALVCLFPALFGAFVGVRRRILTVHHAYLIGAVNTALTILTTWSTGWYDPAHLPARWPGVPWSTRLLPFLLVS